MRARRTIPACILLLASLLVLTSTTTSAQPELSPDAALQALFLREKLSPIAPTVTAEMGDVGGKSFGAMPDPAKTRHYYIAAELDAWDFAPEGADVVCGKPLPPQIAARHAAMKIRFFQYSDATFTAKLFPNERLGILGPVLRGIVGDTLAITFFNRTQIPLSMHPHGVKYDKDSEGAYYQPKPGLGAAVGPGAKFTYIWHLDEASGPLPGEPSSKCWLYHSHVSGDDEVNLGLVGFIIVTDPARARPDGTPSDVDREMASLFMIFNESGFSEQDEEAMENAQPGDAAPAAKSWGDLQQELEVGARYGINGCIFGNLKGLEVNQGERVRWYLFGLGSETDMHTAHWHGLRVVEEGRRRTDVVELLPATMKVADMVAENPGSWLFHCHVAEHMREGMFTRVIVHPKSSQGISKSPDVAYFGLQPGEQSLHITQAECTLPVGSRNFDRGELQIRGSVTVTDAFSIFTAPMEVKLGGKSVSFQPAIDGTGNAQGVNFTITNGGRYGVVYGGRMEFRATFTGSQWLGEVAKAAQGLQDKGASEVPVSMELTIGAAHHPSTLRIPLPPK